jgi:rhodanese-related sulfurtransferase
MPTYFDDDDTPIVQFDMRFEISSFLVFRRLRDGKPVTLIDVRQTPAGYTLEGSVLLTDDWEPPTDRPVVFFDNDGREALAVVERFHERGFTNVKALFGGLDLWKFSLDPEILGEETFLVPLAGPR